jgi:hypothetical protein
LYNLVLIILKNFYIHNFACWAAARAVQNPHLNGTGTEKIRKALDDIDIYSHVEDSTKLIDYSNAHKVIVKQLLMKLNWNECVYKYGVASKIIAIYFKVSIIIPNNEPWSLMEKIYPPIDSYNISKIKGFEKFKWTKLDESTFYKMITSLEKQLEMEKSNFIEFESQNIFCPNFDKKLQV